MSFFFVVEVVLAEHKIDAVFQERTEACLQVDISDAKWFHVGPGYPIYKIHRNFD